jgi:hypothetical protein
MHGSARNCDRSSTRRSSTVENTISAVRLLRVNIMRSYVSYELPSAHNSDAKLVQVLGTESLSSDRLFGGLNGRAKQLSRSLAAT